MESSTSAVYPVTEIVINLQKFEQQEEEENDAARHPAAPLPLKKSSTSSASKHGTVVEIPLQDLYVDRQKTNSSSKGGHTASNRSGSGSSKDGSPHLPPLTVVVPYVSTTTTTTSTQSGDTATNANATSSAEISAVIDTTTAATAFEIPQPPPPQQRLDEDTVLIQTFIECFGVIPATAAAAAPSSSLLPPPPPTAVASSSGKSNGSSGSTGSSNLNGIYVCIRHVQCPVIYGLYSTSSLTTTTATTSSASSSTSKKPPRQNDAFRINSCRYCYMDETRCGIHSRYTEPEQQQERPKSIYQILQLVQAYAMNNSDYHSNNNNQRTLGSNEITTNNNQTIDLMGKDSERSTSSINSIGDYTVSALFLQNSMTDGNGSGGGGGGGPKLSMTVPPEVVIPSTTTTNTATPTTSQPQHQRRLSLASRILLSYRNNYNNIMELSLKRIHQVQNFTLQLYKQQMLDYQQLIIKLQYDIVQKEEHYQSTIKQLRRTIQQDCKVIKTMATQQQDVEYALGLSSQHNIHHHHHQQPSTHTMIDNDPLIASMLVAGQSDSISTIASISPNKQPIQQALPVTAGAGASVPINLKKVPFRTRSSMSQSTHHQQQATEETIHESGLEDETETSATSETNFGATPTITTDNHAKATADMATTATSSPQHASRGAILQLQQNWNRPKLRTRNNNNSNYNDELGGLKSSHEVFQSFRGGLLDIPRSPPALIRHDNFSIESDDMQHPQQRPLKGTKNKAKKILMNSDMMSALQIPTRGLLSRSDSMVVPTNPNANHDGTTPKGSNNNNNILSSMNYNHTLASMLVAKLQEEELDFRTNHGDEYYNPIRSMTSPPPLAMSMKPTATMTTKHSNSQPQNQQQQQQQLPSIPLQSPDGKSPYTPANPQQQLPMMININIPTISSSDVADDSDDYESETAIDDTDVEQSVVDEVDNRNNNGSKLLFSVTNATCHDKFGDEGTYTGSILVTEGLPHGLGKMNYGSGRVYDGEWICGQWHGRGKLLNPNGDSYDGEFFFDARHGHGLYQWDNGDIYVGNFTSDKRHGRGKFSFHNGNVYEGEFCDGLFDGYGKYNFAGGSYEGNWKDGRYNGTGVLTYGNTGGKYEGEFRNSVAHGFGTEIMPDGKQRRGVWVDGKPTEDIE